MCALNYDNMIFRDKKIKSTIITIKLRIITLNIVPNIALFNAFLNVIYLCVNLLSVINSWETILSNSYSKFAHAKSN